MQIILVKYQDHFRDYFRYVLLLIWFHLRPADGNLRVVCLLRKFSTFATIDRTSFWDSFWPHYFYYLQCWQWNSNKYFSENLPTFPFSVKFQVQIVPRPIRKVVSIHTEVTRIGKTVNVLMYLKTQYHRLRCL